MKSIMISIKPEWVAKILNGEKTIEVRKTAPKCELPIDVYIYCTQGKYLFAPNGYNEHWWVQKYFGGESEYNKKVVAKFTLREVEKFDFISDRKYEDNPLKYNEEIRKHNRICREACLSAVDVVCYLDTKCLGSDNPSGMIGYAWHISDLVIFDRPRELSEFIPPKWDKCGVKDKNGLYQCNKCPYADWANIQCKRKPLTKAPESWCYMEEKE